MDERRIERALRSSPPFATDYEPRTLDLEAPALPTRAYAALPWVAAAVVVAVLGTAIAVGSGVLRLPSVETGPPSASPDASETPAAVRRVDHDDAWPGVVRDEEGRRTGVVPVRRNLIEGLRLHRDPSGDVGSAPAWADLMLIEMRISATDDHISVYFDLASGRDDEAVAAYGVVVDVDADGVPDYRIGMDNLDGAHHREWVSELATGDASINDFDKTGGYGWAAFGLSADTYFPGQDDPADEGHLLADLGAPGVRFYVWASAMDEDGGVLFTDYAPDVGWFENRSCENGCSDPSAPPAPGG